MIEGVVNILKPPGMSSSDVVTDVRRIVGTRRVGHAGTLDPGAAGVLPICIGRATRLFDYLIHGDKEYIAEIAFGKATDTQDAYGKVIAVSDVTPTETQLIDYLPSICGDVMQTAPIYSALSVNGTRMYKLARAGEQVEPRVRQVHVESAEYIGCSSPGRYLIKVNCSKGTFVRTMCHDIGEALGSCAYMSFLLRTRVGAFRVEDSLSIPELAEAAQAGRLGDVVIPPDVAVSSIPAVSVGASSEREFNRLINGADIPFEGYDNTDSVRIYRGREFIGLGLISDGKIRICLRFYGECENG